jgi:hypothetical protein
MGLGCCGLLWLGRFGKKILVAENGSKHQHHEEDGAAHVAAATATAALRLKIWILDFGQRMIPVGDAKRRALFLW